ncbi:glycoside hydrolase family 99-like domain-containing protein [Methanobacterium alcaliphilum]|uniref:glycoside hydrolase family 99-like domain-containing protein n=1 Tax=Methanobacterium alcaliphilum TaxID=392018 RepID=UPI00200B1900|nr:glycoside hydrolase family 99-like domain-containing protein [Methanobacterium alcaliphilum]MCK9152234.1 glycoside hydrolase family 99-like domain-containing protein [Methanobacterium alcaliphilum]
MSYENTKIQKPSIIGFIKQIYKKLPITQQKKTKIKNGFYIHFGFLLKNKPMYKNWKKSTAHEKLRVKYKKKSQNFSNLSKKYGKLKNEHQINSQYIFNLLNSSNKYSSFVEYEDNFNVNLTPQDIKLIAFYLPQFHPIKENDEWWGKGFTEWTNVSKALPKFIGHYQPHLPIDLGFYDLRLIETQKRQIELAKKYGIFGFCFYYYWFNGKRLLEKPLNMFLNNPELNLPFCLCWANENWSRRWDGMDEDILIAQKYSPEDDLNIIKDLSKYFKDGRYIKIDGKHLIIVYKPQLLPKPRETFKIWREYFKKENLGELFILGAKRHDFTDPETYGLDGAVEFPPNTPHPTQSKPVQFINKGANPTVYDLEKFVANKEYMEEDNYFKFKTVIPSWDNTARRGNNGQVYVSDPSIYKKWLSDVITFTNENMDQEKRYIFINAWNEWAEGAHLEPDQKFGYGYLKATAEAILESRKKE